MHANHHALVREACRQMAWSQGQVARIIGCSLRTVQRRPESAGVLDPWEHHRFIKAVHPRNPDLAARLATSYGTSLEELGLVAPKAAPPPPPPPPAARREHADAVVAAAADALNLVPRDARPVVAAIFSRVSELEVDIPSLVKLLKGDAAPTKPAAKK